MQYGCQNEILIPVVDADGDDVRCRWSNGTECVSICDALPNAVIDSVSLVKEISSFRYKRCHQFTKLNKRKMH